MAGPHVAGAVALLWSAVPALRGDVDRTEELLERTARPLRKTVEGCGGDYAFGPNNSWGEGVIDVAQALTEDISLQPTALEIVIIEGDASGVLEAGETFRAAPTWFNPGTLVVPNVTGKPRRRARAYCFAKGSASYGSIPGGEKKPVLPAGSTTATRCGSRARAPPATSMPPSPRG